MRYAENRAEAEDFLHDGFIKLFSVIKKYSFRGSFEGWARKIFAYTCIDSLRIKQRMVFRTIQDVSEEPERIIELIQSLSPQYRTIFNMYVFEECSHREIADKLGIAEGTSKSNYHKAKRNLQKLCTNESMLCSIKK